MGGITEDELSRQAVTMRDQDRAKRDLLSAEEKYRDAVRDRETKSLDATEQIGRAEAELLALQTEAAALADNTAQKFEALADIEKKRLEIMDLQTRRQEEAVRLADEEARAAERTAQARQDLESLTAELSGPKAELELQRRRTREAGERARQSGSVEDSVAAQRETLRLAQMEGSRLRDTAFDEEDARRRGARAAEAARGALPSLDAAQAGLGMQQLAQGMSQALRDTAATRMMPVIANPDGAKDGTVDEVRARVQECVDRLDQIIRVSGTFTY